MELIINHQTRFFQQLPPSLAVLVQSEIPDKTKGIAVAVNHQVISKEAWSTTKLQDKDFILIISATQGG